MVEPTPLQAFADLLYQHESELARRSSQMDQFLRSASLDGAVARALIDREAETEPYARFHASRFLDLLRALSAVCDGLGTGSVDVLDCGIGPVTRLYRKVIARATLRTTSLPRPFSAAETAKKFDSSDHRYIDLDFEPIAGGTDRRPASAAAPGWLPHHINAKCPQSCLRGQAVHWTPDLDRLPARQDAHRAGTQFSRPRIHAHGTP